MCNLSQGVREKGVAEGMAKGIVKGRAEGMAENTLASIKSLVKNIGVSVEQAMSVLEIPEIERQKYRNLLNQK